MDRMDHARAFRLFERLARDVHAAPGLREARAQLLRAVLGELGGDSATFFEPGATSPAQTACIETPAAIVDLYLARRARYERSNRPMFAALERGPAIDSEVYCARERERLAIYDEVFKPQGARSILASWLRLGNRRLGVLVLKRHDAAKAFLGREAQALSQLAPLLSLIEAGFARVPAAPFMLSPREHEVAALAAKGLRNSEIAVLLGTSLGTVKKQLGSAMEKAGVSSRAELATELATRRN